MQMMQKSSVEISVLHTYSTGLTCLARLTEVTMTVLLRLLDVKELIHVDARLAADECQLANSKACCCYTTCSHCFAAHACKALFAGKSAQHGCAV
jgi:hypothetical protein